MRSIRRCFELSQWVPSEGAQNTMDEFAWRMARAVYPFLAAVGAMGLILNTVLLLATIRTK